MTLETYFLSALLSTIALASIFLLGLSVAEGWGTPAIQRRIEPYLALRRPLLGFLTLIAILSLGQSLIGSWSEPQIQSRLELYQTNLVLHATEWQKLTEQPGSGLEQAGKGLLGNDPLQGAIDQYQEVHQSATKNLEKFQANLRELEANPDGPPLTSNAPAQRPPSRNTSVQQQQLRKSIQQVQTLLDELDLRLGILLAQKGKGEQAGKTWQELGSRSSPLSPVAESLQGLWSDPPQLFPDAEIQFRRDLDGWFRYQALSRLYQLQQRQDVLQALQVEERDRAQQAIGKLLIVGSIPALGFLGGISLLIFLIAQRLMRGKDSLLARHGTDRWATPWTGDTVWQVFVVGFFVIGQVFLPSLLSGLFQTLRISPTSFSEQTRAFSVLASYVLLSSGGLLVLYLSLKPYFPLPEGWFPFRWQPSGFAWGLGGYVAAIPLVIVISLINQQLWQGQGGSNPILPIALEGKDKIALAVFFITASIAAPLFEEFMFRGFLLPSLTRYMSVTWAIVLSSFLFALAHLNLSEVLPLTVLGMVLGVVFTRSRNLLASMLLHGLWNSGTLVSLIVLGSGSSS